MKKSALIDILIGEHAKRFDIGKRIDGSFNVWKKMIDFNKDGTYSIFWSVVDVVPSEADAIRVKNTLARV